MRARGGRPPAGRQLARTRVVEAGKRGDAPRDDPTGSSHRTREAGLVCGGSAGEKVGTPLLLLLLLMGNAAASCMLLLHVGLNMLHLLNYP